jgi:hypothetical protein
MCLTSLIYLTKIGVRVCIILSSVTWTKRILADKTTPTFSFDPNNANRINQVDDLGLQSSRWQMLLDIRSNSSVFWYQIIYFKSPSFRLEMRTFSLEIVVFIKQVSSLKLIEFVCILLVVVAFNFFTRMSFIIDW